MSVHWGLPKHLFTKDPEDKGLASRVRVTQEQAGFYEGRQFRTFAEYTLAANQTRWIKAVVGVNSTIQGMGFVLDEGYVRMRIWALATETTPFTAPMTIRTANSMTERPQPYYTTQVQLFDDGACTLGSGLLLDIVRAKTSSNSNQSSTNEVSVPGDRGLPPGTYYVSLENLNNNAPAALLFKARWEERP